MFLPLILQTTDAGDISERVELRKRLGCKSFKWYLDNIYPEKFIPDENVIGYGMVRSCHGNHKKLRNCVQELILHYSIMPYLMLSCCYVNLPGV